jgi:hypothetical protein
MHLKQGEKGNVGNVEAIWKKEHSLFFPTNYHMARFVNNHFLQIDSNSFPNSSQIFSKERFVELYPSF